MRLHPVPGVHPEELVLRVQHRVEEEEVAALREPLHAFHLVLVTGVACGDPEPHAVIHHPLVIHADRFHRRAPRENRLPASPEPREVVEDDRSRENHVVDVAEQFIDEHRRPARRLPEVLEILVRVAVGIKHRDTGGNLFPHRFRHLVPRHLPVGSERKDDLHVVIRGPEAVQFIQEHRHEVERIRDAGEVVTDKADGVARFHPFVERSDPNRVPDRFEDLRFHRFLRDRGEGLRPVFSDYFVLRQRHGFHGVAIRELIRLQRHFSIPINRDRLPSTRRCRPQASRPHPS